MFVDDLQLTDFRSYESVDLTLESGVTTFVGANGQGKTNLVEAIEYVSTMSSHRVASEVPLVRSGAARAIVRARVQAGLDDPRQLTLELEINPGKANRARLNRAPLRQAKLDEHLRPRSRISLLVERPAEISNRCLSGALGE